MIKTGIDIVEIGRIARLSKKNSFKELLLTDYEVDYIKSKTGKDTITGEEILPYSTIAGLYAAKEAVTKAMGIGLTRRLNFKEIEVNHTKKGAPIVKLSGYMQEFADKLGVREISLSISHDGGLAVAICSMI